MGKETAVQPLIVREQFNVGKAKYVVNYHIPGKQHADGSNFYDIRIFRNKKAKDAFMDSLLAAQETE